MFLTPSAACSQSPVNNPINTSMIESISFNTPSMIVAITPKAPSNNGARTSHSPVHNACITSVMFSKSKPSSLILSTTPSKKSLNDVLILFQISVILFLKSSFVFHKVANTETSAPIAATTIKTGAEIPDNALAIPKDCFENPSIANSAADIPFFNCVTAAKAGSTVLVINPKALITVLTTPASLDKINITGPTAAAINPNLTIISCVLSSMLLNFSIRLVIHSARSRMYGVNLFPITIPADSNAPPNCSTAPARLSCITSAVSAATPVAFSMLSAILSYSSCVIPNNVVNPDIPSCPANTVA